MGEPRRTHQLKTWPEYFQAVSEGRKRFELRVNDRDFRTGDRLELQEFVPGLDGGFTGRECDVDVAYVLHGGMFGLPSDTVIMSIEQARSEGPHPESGEWVMVPREPTEAMLDAGASLYSDMDYEWALTVYRAMIAASSPLEGAGRAEDGSSARVSPETLAAHGDISSLIAARCVALPGALVNCPVCGAVDRERTRLSKGEALPVGEAGSIPGTDGFTMAAFRAADVPIGTKLYVRPSPGVSREEVADALAGAFEAGCWAVQANYQPDQDPEFGEAASDYAASVIDGILSRGEG